MIKFTDYLNKKKNNTVSLQDTVSPTVGKAPSYTDALSILSKNKKTPIGAEKVQLTEQTPIYSDTARPGVLTPNAGVQNTNPVSVPTPVPAQPEPAQKPMSFEEYILSVKSKADDRYKRDLLTARNTYDQSRSGYGTQAAALGNMGLTGSGYSAYLDSKAYGQMQADKNAAARMREDSKYAADVKYMDYLTQQDANRTNMFNALYDNVGNLSNADIDTLATVNGLTSDQVAALKTGRLERVTATLDNSENGYKKSDLERLFDQSIPEEKSLYDKYYAKLADTVGKVDENDFYDENGELYDASYVKEIIANAKESGVPEKDIKYLEDMYNRLYTVAKTASGGTVRVSSGFKPDKVGDNFKVEWSDSAGKKQTFKIENGGKVSASNNVYRVTAGIDDNTVFYYDGKLYLKNGEDIYTIEARYNPEDYHSLMNAFKNDLNKE